jgi:hypothetical protein
VKLHKLTVNLDQLMQAGQVQVSYPLIHLSVLRRQTGSSTGTHAAFAAPQCAGRSPILLFDVSRMDSSFYEYVIKNDFSRSVDISMESTYGSSAHPRGGGARPVRVRLGWGGRAMRQERFAQFGGSLPVACFTGPDF